MFKINDYVIYGSNGVCRVENIEKVSLRNKELEYYILSPIFNIKMTIKIPVNNVSTAIRELMSKNQISDLIKNIQKNETFEFEDTRRRSEEYKSIIKTGNTEDIIKVINSIKMEKGEKESLGKKLNKTDEDTMDIAIKKLYQEISIVLGINVEEVGAYIKKESILN